MEILEGPMHRLQMIISFRVHPVTAERTMSELLCTFFSILFDFFDEIFTFFPDACLLSALPTLSINILRRRHIHINNNAIWST